MNKDWLTENQKQIVDQMKNNGNGPAAGLTENQAAAQAAIRALAELTALAGTVSISRVNLGDLAGRWGSQQLANDDDQWTQAAVSDWIQFDNYLARAAMALYLAADMRGTKLHLLAKARVELDAEIKARNDGPKRRV